MKGGIKTKASKNRLIPIANKILPLIEWFFKPVNEYLLTVNGVPLLNVQNLRQQIWSKSSLLTNHLPHDGHHTCATLMDDAEKQCVISNAKCAIKTKIISRF